MTPNSEMRLEGEALEADLRRRVRTLRSEIETLCAERRDLGAMVGRVLNCAAVYEASPGTSRNEEVARNIRAAVGELPGTFDPPTTLDPDTNPATGEPWTEEERREHGIPTITPATTIDAALREHVQGLAAMLRAYPDYCGVMDLAAALILNEDHPQRRSDFKHPPEGGTP